MTARPAFLKADSISVEFDTASGPVRVIDKVSFEIGRGEIVALVGESGSGKSVTAQAVMGLLSRIRGRLAEGSVWLGDNQLSAMNERKLADFRGRDISMIFQEPSRALNPSIRVGEQIAETVRRHKPETSKQQARERAVEMLRLVEIPEPEIRADDYPHQMSGGQCQRVMIAMALACDPAFLIADEPTTALDVTVQAQVLRLLVRLRDELGLGILLITHDLGVVAEVCDRAIVMYAGEVVESGVVPDIFDSPSHPYTSGLLGSVPVAQRPGQRFIAIPGAVPLPKDWPVGCRFQNRCEFAIAGTCTDGPIPLVATAEDRVSRCARVGEIRLTGVPDASELPQAESVFEIDEAERPLIAGTMLRKTYSRRKLFSRGSVRPAVRDIDVHVRRGETLAVVGESGAGKSTLGRLLNRLEEPDSGEIRFGDVDVRALSRGHLRGWRKDVQMIFQDPYNSLNPLATVGSAVEEAMLVHGIGTKESRRDSAAELFSRVGLRVEHMERFPYEFSGGQLQRIAIARALATNPKLIICDEPVAALDMSIRAQILNLLADLQRERGLAYIFVTHDLSLVRAIAHRVLVMRGGQAVEMGPAEQVFTAPETEYTRTLLAAIPTIGGEGRRFASTPEAASSDA